MNDVLVSGASTIAVNGKYIYQGTNASSEPYWKHETENLWLSRDYTTTGYYFIVPSGDYWDSCLAGDRPNPDTITDGFLCNMPGSQYTTYTGRGIYGGETVSVCEFNYLPDIYTLSDLQALSALVSYDSAYFLMADINCNNLGFNIGSSVAFDGIFYGNNYTLSNLKNYSSSDIRGSLFSTIDSGSVYDLHIECYVQGDDFIGGLAGKVYAHNGDVHIENVHVTNNASYSSYIVKGSSYVGGLIGLYGSGNYDLYIDACSVDGNIGNYNTDGSICGIFIGCLETWDTTTGKIYISNSNATGIISCKYAVGGFLGYIYLRNLSNDTYVYIDNCHANNITIIGYCPTSYDSDYKCHAGFLGRWLNWSGTYSAGYYPKVSITNCSCSGTMDYSTNYTNSNCKTPREVGGFYCGGNAGIIENCLSDMTIVMADLWYIHSTWGYKYLYAGGFTSYPNTSVHIRNCKSKGTLIAPDNRSYNATMFCEITDVSYPDLEGVYERGYNFSGTYLVNPTKTGFIVNAADGYYYLLTRSQFDIYDADTSVNPVNGFKCASMTGIYNGVGSELGNAITVASHTNTDSRCIHTGGFYGHIQQTIYYVEDVLYTSVDTCVSEMVTANVMHGFSGAMLSTDKRTLMIGIGNYYDKTKSPESKILPEQADNVTALTTAELTDMVNMAYLDFDTVWTTLEGVVTLRREDIELPYAHLDEAAVGLGDAKVDGSKYDDTKLAVS